VTPETNRIYHGDCLDIMKAWPDKCIDLILTDPPYGIGADTAPVRGIQRYAVLGSEGKGWDASRPHPDVFAQMLRVSKHQIIWGGNYFADLLPASMGWLCWDKGQREFSLADGELAWTSFDKAMRIFTYSRATAMKDGKEHPTQKPLDLFAWCLRDRVPGGGYCLRPLSGLGDHRARLREDGDQVRGH
jgi:DNA modification methylase